jgi:hypothetical protein
MFVVLVKLTWYLISSRIRSCNPGVVLFGIDSFGVISR